MKVKKKKKKQNLPKKLSKKSTQSFWASKPINKAQQQKTRLEGNCPKKPIDQSNPIKIHKTHKQNHQ
jgi:hypothetical protein